MKRILAFFLLLSLLLCAASSLADGGSADFQYDGTTYHVTYAGSELDEDGKLNVKLSGFGSGVPIRNNKMIIVAWANVIVGGKEIESQTVHISTSTGDGVYSYVFDTDQMPEEVLLYPYEDPKNGIPVWKTGDPVMELPSAEAASAVPEELVGSWKGTGTPKNGGPAIDLSAEIKADGTGEYVFIQDDYRESYPFTISSEDNRFTVDIPEDNLLHITECGGTWTLEEGKLLLDITTVFANGRSYSYTAECVKE